ncbi:MAG: exodeoxyribonuclease V subunit gamma [Vicinamibacteria bacterium]|nr:exodeoxyribonuclease V subunit gamma [Vicinamibacteria bacterium]
MNDLPRLVEAAVARLRGDDPLLPVTVVVPSPLLGTWLSREVFAERGHFGIDWVVAAELAWRLAMPGLLAEGRTRVPENADRAVLMAAMPEALAGGQTPDYLRAAADTAGFATAVLATLGDLGGAGIGPDALEALSAEPDVADPGRLRLLARLARAQTAALADARLVDRPALFAAAAAALPLPSLGGVVFCALAELSAAERAFVEAIARHQPFACVGLDLPAAGVPRAAGRRARVLALGGLPAADGGDSSCALGRVQAGLFASAPGSEPATPHELDASVTILAAAGESLEAVEIARAIQALAADGVAYDEIAVLLRSPEAYRPALAAALERAGIDAWFLEGGARLDPAARGLSLLLGLIDTDLDRGRVMEFVTSARLRFDALLGPGAEVSPSRWDRLSAEAGIVGGLDNWRKRLAQARADRLEREWREDRDPLLYDSLVRLVERLDADLARLPAQGSWSALLATVLELLDQWIQDGALTRERLVRVLGPLTDHAPAVARGAFLARVQDVLASQFYREGELGDGRVFVGSIASARGMRFRAVFVPGLVERAFPQVARPDPLLLDDERERLSPDLATTRDAAEAERVLFLDAVRCAGERLVLSYPRFDSASGRERIPSSFLLHAAECALGRRLTAAQLVGLAQAGHTELGRPHPLAAEAALDRVERDLALVASGQRAAARHLAGESGLLSRAFEQAEARWSPRWTVWDGALDAPTADELARLRLAGQQTSVSRAETFAKCPYRHFLAVGLRLKRWQEPAREYRMQAVDYGSLYHEVAQALFAGLAVAGGLPPREEDVPRAAPRIAKLVDEALARHAAENGVRHPALLEPERVRLCADLERMLRDEAESLVAGDWVPREFEREFEGVSIPLGDGQAVSFAGRIDRIDVSTKGRRVRVVDYKTGKHVWRREDQWKGGRELQLAVYNEAARALVPRHEVAEAVYYYATAKGEYKRKGLEAIPEAADTLRFILSMLDRQAAAGVFPAVADDCTFCDFQRLCGEGREARAERKVGDPRTAEFLKLREIP